MNTEADAELRRLLSAEIEADQEHVSRLREELARVEPRLTRAIEYFRSRFGEDPVTTPREGVALTELLAACATRRTPGAASHARRAAVALTEAKKVGVPLKAAEVHRELIWAGFGTETSPSRATFISSIRRSPLFEKLPRARYRLTEPLDRHDLQPE